jgi:hypothetical protein
MVVTSPAKRVFQLACEVPHVFVPAMFCRHGLCGQQIPLFGAEPRQGCGLIGVDVLD